MSWAICCCRSSIYTQMGAEEGRFDFETVATAIADKMIERHPHVFGDRRGRRQRRAQDRMGGPQGGRARVQEPRRQRPCRRPGRLPGTDPRAQAAEAGGPGRLRLGCRRADPGQDRGGDRRAARRGRRGRSPGRARARAGRPPVHGRQPRPPPRHRPGDGAAGDQRQVRAAVQMDGDGSSSGSTAQRTHPRRARGPVGGGEASDRRRVGGRLGFGGSKARSFSS